MLIVFLAILIAAISVTVWATRAVTKQAIFTQGVKMSYVGAQILAAGTAFLTTFYYGYLADANTYIAGWPVPEVIFQRTGPSSPWLDFVGPTVLLAYPINLLLYMTLPSLGVLIVSFLKRRRI